MAGGLQPPPHPQGTPRSMRLDPFSTVGPGEDGLGQCTSPRTCTQLLFPSTTLGKLCIFGYITHTHTHTPINPRARSSPEEMPQLAAQCCGGYRAAVESGTATPDLLPIANIVKAWTEFNQSGA